MFQIVTLPEWERPMPDEYCTRGETYWSCVELPVRNNWVFVVNLQEEPGLQLSMRSIAIVSANELLVTIGRYGEGRIRSIHLVTQRVEDDHDELAVDRLVSIEVGVDPEARWNKAIELRMQSGRTYCAPNEDAVRRMLNRIKVFRL